MYQLNPFQKKVLPKITNTAGFLPQLMLGQSFNNHEQQGDSIAYTIIPGSDSDSISMLPANEDAENILQYVKAMTTG